MQYARLGAMCVLLCAAAPGQNSPTPPPMPGRLVDAGGYRVHLYCTGSGSPAVIVVSGGFSIDWGLVQPQVARFTRICTYDPAWSAWSDRPEGHQYPSCSERVAELSAMLANSGVPRPWVLVGYSIGGLIARLFASRYPAEVAGLVLVDHAFIDTHPDSDSGQPPVKMSDVDTPPVLISTIPIALDMEDDQNFSRLPRADQEAHRWALSVSMRPTVDMARQCVSEVTAVEHKAAVPLVVVSTANTSPGYADLQKTLLALSSRSTQIIAAHSTHMVIIDEPGVVVRAIRDAVSASSSK